MILETVNNLIITECDRIKTILIEKNSLYNNSLHAEPPLFKVDPEIGIKSRINDKLNRIKMTGLSDATEDTLDDLIELANSDLVYFCPTPTLLLVFITVSSGTMSPAVLIPAIDDGSYLVTIVTI